MMLHVILATFLCGCIIAVSANERPWPFVPHNAGSEAKILYRAPVFEKIFETVIVEESQALELLCSATSDLPITYKWLDPDEYEISSDTSQNIHTFLTEAGSYLFMTDVSIKHQGAYTCIASDEHGLTSKFFNIRVKDKESENESGSAQIVRVVEAVKNNSISFKIYTVGSVEKIFVQYSEIRSFETYSTLEWKFRGLGPYEVTNLTASGKYSFQFRLSESDAWSKIYTYVMLPDMPQVIFGGLIDGTLKIQWFQSIENIMRGTIDKHELSYYTISQVKGNYFEKSDCAVTVEIPKCSGAGYTITSLQKNVYYEIRLRAHTSEGYGEPYYFIIRP